jgi:xylulokinase
MLSLGIDSGTQSTKTIVLDVESGEILASAQQPYEMIDGLPPGHCEQAPQTWIEAVESTISACVAKLGNRRSEITSIGVSGQQHGLVALDAANEPIRPAKLWCDTSTAAQCEQFNQEFGGVDGLIKLVGNAMVPGLTAPKILWLKQNEPQHFQALKTIFLPHDYINFWLTGERQMEYGDASGTGLMDVRTRSWSQPILKFIDADLEEKLPPLRSSHRPAGLLRNKLREAWGLNDGVLVSAGGGDNMISAIGTGNIRAGVVTVSFGTSGTICAFSEEPVIDPRAEIAAFCDSTDHWLPLACTMNVTVATEQVRELFRWDIPTLEGEMAKAPPGARGVLFLPYLQGERTPNLPRGSGVFHGLNTENMAPAEMARAVVEGVTLGLAYGMRRFIELGVVPNEIRLTGGGSKSAAWRQIAADVFSIPMVCLQTAEGGALGAAIQAAWTYCQTNGKPISLEALVDDIVRLDKKSRVEPRKENQQLYVELLAKQTDLARKLKAGGYL